MDPFFTTNAPHKGAGLGLSTVTGILKGHGGFLLVDSQLGEGTAFKVYLPAQDISEETAGKLEPEQRLDGTGKVIIFVDDEVDFRNVAALILQRKGFKPVTVVDGADGLIKVLMFQSELQAIILDLHMPTIDGLEFARRIRQFPSWFRVDAWIPKWLRSSDVCLFMTSSTSLSPKDNSQSP